MRSQMVWKCLPLLVSLLVLSSALADICLPQDTGATVANPRRIVHFQVTARDPDVARLVAETAAEHRKALALRWLGHELPPWESPCPIRVQLSVNGTGGATTFAFENGRVLSQEMSLEGTLETILNSALPHEVMHTILAHHFGMPVPRWADEGVAVFAEGENEQKRHDELTRQILKTPGRAIPLARLLVLKQYPPDVMVLYAEGYSLTKFLVQREGERTFLNFVRNGQKLGWDTALCDCYGFTDVDELEQVWLDWVKDRRKKPDKQEQPGPAEKINPPRGL